MATKGDQNNFLQRFKSRLARIPGLGIWLSILSNVVFAFNIITTKAIVNERNVLVVGSVQSFIRVSMLLPVIVFNRLAFFGVKEERYHFFFFSTVNALLQLSRTYAYAFISAGDASAIVMSYPVVVTLIAPFILKETFRKIYVFNALLAMAGIFLVVRPSFIFGDKPHDPSEGTASDHWAGISLSVASMFLTTAIFILIRGLRKSSSSSSCACSAAISFFFFGIPCLARNNYNYPDCGMDSVFMLLASVLQIAGLLIFYVACKFEEAGPLSVTATINVPLILVLEMATLGTVPPWTSCFGSCLILLGILLTALTKWEAGRRRLKAFFR